MHWHCIPLCCRAITFGMRSSADNYKDLISVRRLLVCSVSVVWFPWQQFWFQFTTLCVSCWLCSIFATEHVCCLRASRRHIPTNRVAMARILQQTHAWWALCCCLFAVTLLVVVVCVVCFWWCVVCCRTSQMLGKQNVLLCKRVSHRRL